MGGTHEFLERFYDVVHRSLSNNGPVMMLYVGSTRGDTLDQQHAMLVTEIIVDQARGRQATYEYATRPQDLYYRVLDPSTGRDRMVDSADLLFYFGRRSRGPGTSTFGIGGYLLYATSSASPNVPSHPDIFFPRDEL